MRGLYRRGTRWWYRFTFQGRRYFVSTGQSDEARAILVARQIRQEPGLVVTDTIRIEIREYLAQLENQGARPNYVNNLRDRLSDWAKAFDGAELAKIGQADIQRWFDAKRGAVLPNTAVAYLDDVRRFFKWARLLSVSGGSFLLTHSSSALMTQRVISQRLPLLLTMYSITTRISGGRRTAVICFLRPLGAPFLVIKRARFLLIRSRVSG
jgi:hypothetical protein